MSRADHWFALAIDQERINADISPRRSCRTLAVDRMTAIQSHSPNARVVLCSVMPCPKLACPCHGLACHVKIVHALSERVMIDPCQCRSVPIHVHADPCQSVSNPGVVIFAKKNSACGKLVSSNRACQIQGWSFSMKKSACGKLDSSSKAC